jgi:hypothetical protein
MTWLGDAKAKPTDEVRKKLLDDRAKLEAEILALKARGPAGKMAHHIQFFQEDLLALARKMTKIDEKLGRHVDRS